MNDNLRLLLAFILVMMVLFLWQMMLPRRLPIPKPSSVNPDTISTKTTIGIESPKHTERPKVKSPPRVFQEKETTYILENSYLYVKISNINGDLKEVYLKKYRAQLIPETQPIKTFLETEETPTLYRLAYQDDSTLILENTLRKTYRLKKDHYLLTLEISRIIDASQTFIFDYQTGLALTEYNPNDPLKHIQERHREELRHFSIFYRTPYRTEKKSAQGVKSQTIDSISWVALKSKYFTNLLSLNSISGKLEIMPLSDGRVGYRLKASFLQTLKAELYLGPIDYALLKKSQKGWEAVAEWGWTRIINLVILKVLKFLYFLVRNYGIAIIIFALLMKAIFFPLTRLQTRQMHQMQLLQPKLEELKKRYKNDPQTLNRETMQLYQLYKVNPFIGCLPLIFQLPIFWALYSVLQKTIELRGAPFVFWIKDLSLKDPYYILPILMGLSFLAQNFLTSTDRKNMVLLIFMPIFLTVIFLNFPSGLQLYWLTFNLLSISESLISRGGIKWRKKKILTQTK
jgi:YidC/Oxa1 family membrane protein insertase